MKETTINAELESFQEIVGGLIEVVSLPKDIYLVVNEEGKLNGLNQNFALVVSNKGDCCSNQLMDIIAGDCFFIAKRSNHFKSLNDEQVRYIYSRFNLDETLFILDRRAFNG